MYKLSDASNTVLTIHLGNGGKGVTIIFGVFYLLNGKKSNQRSTGRMGAEEWAEGRIGREKMVGRKMEGRLRRVCTCSSGKFLVNFPLQICRLQKCTAPSVPQGGYLGYLMWS